MIVSTALISMGSAPVKIDAFDFSKISLELCLSLLEAHFAHLGIIEETKKKNQWIAGTSGYGHLQCARQSLRT